MAVRRSLEGDTSANQPKLILHIGPHKTGTTALQLGLALHQNALQKLDWTYIQKFSCGLSVHSLADCLSTGQVQRAKPALDSLSNCEKNVVLSSENFSRLSRQQISTLADSINHFKISIVYYIREPSRRLFSAWQEWVKHGYAYTFPEYLCARMASFLTDPEINDLVRIQEWELGLPQAEMQILNYDSTSDVPTDFLDRFFGLSISSTRPEVKRVNESLSLSRTEAIRASHGAYRGFLLDKAAKEKLGNIFSDIESEISEFQSSGLFVNSIDIAVEGGPLSIIEENLAKKYPHFRRGDGFVFPTRKISWRYISNDIWSMNPHLSEKMTHFRNEMRDLVGPPRLDVRLKRV